MEAGIVKLTGAITLNDAIYTDDVSGTAGDVTLTGAVSLADNITIDTSDGDGFVKFTTTVDSSTDTAKGLTILSGDGTVTIDGKIGAGETGGGDKLELAALSINATTPATNTGDIELFDIGDAGSVGTTTATIGNTGTTTITLDGAYYLSLIHI